MASIINKALHTVTNRISFLEPQFRGNNNFSPRDLPVREKRFRDILGLSNTNTDVAVLAFVVALENTPDLKTQFDPQNQTYDLKQIVVLQGTTEPNFYFNGNVIYFNALAINFNGQVTTTVQSYNFEAKTKELLNDREFINFAVSVNADILSRALLAQNEENYIEVMACVCTILGLSNL